MLLGSVLVLAAPLFAAGPPAPVSPRVKMLIEQLGDDDFESRKSAMKKLEAEGEPVLPVLRVTAKDHSDVDVRLRAAVVMAAIDKKLDGEVKRFVGHKEGAITLALSPDGKRVVSTSYDRTARMWDARTGKLIQVLEGHTDLVPWLSKREGLMEKGLDINPSPDRLYTAAVQHLLKGLAEAAITASASQDTPTPDTVSPV